MKAERSLADWLEHLERLHPKSIDMGLERVSRVADELALRRDPPRTVTVAGTNGKGSCVAALDSLLMASGERVGVYTSPHLLRFNERIAIDGAPVSDEQIVAAFSAIETARADISLSYFEFATLAALWLFKQAGVTWQVLEVGLGGRLDAVNCIDAEACVITSIGLDHTDWLGDTRELIAREKAGVARVGCPAIVAETDPPVTLLATIKDVGALPLVINEHWFISEDNSLVLPTNLAVTLPVVQGLRPQNIAAAVVLLAQLGIDPTPEWISEGLSNLSLRGRQQRVVFQNRDVWFDVAHNREAVEALAHSLTGQPNEGACHAIFGAMADKPLADMIRVMEPLIDHWHLPACFSEPRAAKPTGLAQLIHSPAVSLYQDSEAAAKGVLTSTVAGDRIVVFGSFVTVGRQLRALTDSAGAGA